MRPLVLIHGYSAEGLDFIPLRDAISVQLAGAAPAIEIDIANYITLNNEVTIKDIAEGLERAFSLHPVLNNLPDGFDAIVHSTGMLVLRSWIAAGGNDPNRNARLQRVKHLIGVAPATWGSPQAHKGRTWLGALVKGDKTPGPDFLNAGDLVLDGLELGSRFTWDLAHIDLLGPVPFYDKDAGSPYVGVFIGNQPYSGIAAVANDPGTDGTVRWSGCALNTRKITVDLTRGGIRNGADAASRVTMSSWADRLDIPMIAVGGRDHGTLISDPEPGMVDRIVSFLAIDSEEQHTQWLTEALAWSAPSLTAMKLNPGKATGVLGSIESEAHSLFHIAENEPAMEGWQQFVVRSVDQRGDGITDYVVEVLTRGEDGAFDAFSEMYEDVHAYRADPSYRCFHVRLPLGICAPGAPIWLRIHASAGTPIVAYQGYFPGLPAPTADPEPIVLDLGAFSQDQGTLFYPFTTTLVEIVMSREPVPFNAISPVLNWWPTGQP